MVEGGCIKYSDAPFFKRKCAGAPKHFSSTTFLTQSFRKVKHPRPCPQERTKETSNFTVDFWSSLLNIYIWKLQKQSCECHQFWVLCLWHHEGQVTCGTSGYYIMSQPFSGLHCYHPELTLCGRQDIRNQSLTLSSLLKSEPIWLPLSSSDLKQKGISVAPCTLQKCFW